MRSHICCEVSFGGALCAYPRVLQNHAFFIKFGRRIKNAENLLGSILDHTVFAEHIRVVKISISVSVRCSIGGSAISHSVGRIPGVLPS